MDLYSSTINTAPSGGVSGYLTGRGGVRFRYARWRATSRKVNGTIVLLQGRAECIEKYYDVVRDLRRRGFAIATLDWRGQGGSDRELPDRLKGYVDDYDTYVSDLDLFLDQIVLPDCPPPYFGLAHSTGGLILLKAAPILRSRLERVVLSSPFLGVAEHNRSEAFSRTMVSVLNGIGFGGISLSRRKNSESETPFEDNKLTSSRERYTKMESLLENAPDLAIGPPIVSWVHASFRAIDQVHDSEFLARIHLPAIFVAAGNDHVVRGRATEELAKRMRSTTCIVIPGARHELLMEADIYREQFWAIFDSFIPGSDYVRSSLEPARFDNVSSII